MSAVAYGNGYAASAPAATTHGQVPRVPNHDGSGQDGYTVMIGDLGGAIGQLQSVTSPFDAHGRSLVPRPSILGRNVGWGALGFFPLSFLGLLIGIDTFRNDAVLPFLCALACALAGAGIMILIGELMSPKAKEIHCTFVGSEGFALSSPKRSPQWVRFDRMSALRIERARLLGRGYTHEKTAYRVFLTNNPQPLEYGETLPEGYILTRYGEIAFGRAIARAYHRWLLPRMAEAVAGPHGAVFRSLGDTFVTVRPGALEVRQNHRHDTVGISAVSLQVAKGEVILRSQVFGEARFQMAQVDNVEVLLALLSAQGLTLG